jgi:myo-inositol-1(or 4)-monophosphatase
MSGSSAERWEAPAMGPLRPEAAVAIAAVDDALVLARARMGVAEVSAKGVRDTVTDADVAIEDQVRALLSEGVGAAVVGEERGGLEPDERGTYWLIDPICGTRNFASGIPLYCINVALVEDGRVSVAVVGDPLAAETLVAQRGQGAWGLGGDAPRRLHASPDTATIVIEDSHAGGERREAAAEFAAAAIRLDRWELRSLSTTLSLAYVAAGRIAGYALFWTSRIHAAAGSLLAVESGAVVTDLAGEPWTIESDSLLAAAHADLHRELLTLARATSGPSRCG